MQDEEILSRFPVGYYSLHPDISLNFQMNRFYNWANDDKMLDKFRAVAPRITDYKDWINEMLQLSDAALNADRTLAAAFYSRAAEFFLDPSDSRYEPARKRFLDNVLKGNGVTDDDYHQVPYQETHLPAYRFTPEQPRGTFICFGGFDSYITEWLPAARAMRDAGLDTIIFEGPGQGTVLDAGLPMTPDWHLPVGAVLDHFDLTDVTLMGFSLGGCLVMRAAAHEPRVKRVVACDILTNLFQCFTRSPTGQALGVIGTHVDEFPDSVIDATFAAIRKTDLLTDWALRQGNRVTGTTTSTELLEAFSHYVTDDISHLVTQDVLLMAGEEDHYVPYRQLGEQLLTLTAAPTIAARVFTEAEQAQNHCQLGNNGVMLKTILQWLDTCGGRSPSPAP